MVPAGQRGSGHDSDVDMVISPYILFPKFDLGRVDIHRGPILGRDTVLFRFDGVPAALLGQVHGIVGSLDKRFHGIAGSHSRYAAAYREFAQHLSCLYIFQLHAVKAFANIVRNGKGIFAGSARQ